MKTQLDMILKNANRLHKLILQKHSRVIVDRVDDKYYITEGHFAVEMTPEMYSKCFTAKNGYFIELKNQERIIIYMYDIENSGKAEFNNCIQDLFYSKKGFTNAFETGLQFRGSDLFIINGEFQFCPSEMLALANSIIPETGLWRYETANRYFVKKCGDISIIITQIHRDPIVKDFENALSQGGYINGKAVQ